MKQKCLADACVFGIMGFFVCLFFNGQRIKCNVWREWEGDDFYSSMMFSWLPRRWSCLDSLGFSGLNEL